MSMKSTQISPEIQKALHDACNRYPRVRDIINDIHGAGGSAVLVGGAVRDLLLGIPLKDLDIELHGLTMVQCEKVLSTYGPVSVVGKSFGVLRLHGLDIDWSLPRSDSQGRKPAVEIDPFMGIEAACRRRDVTMNAMAINLHTYELIDPFGGQQDLADHVLRATDAQLFVQDPLRFFRVMQFISRFEMHPDALLDTICQSMAISAVSRERIEQEFHKMMLKSRRPSLGLRWVARIGRLQDVLPELDATRGVPQNPAWHPEGDVFEHSMQAIDAAAIIMRTYQDPQRQLLLIYATLCHDLGKATTTAVIDGVIRSIMHAPAGVSLARAMLKRIIGIQDLIEGVARLVQYHMEPGQFIKGNATLAAYKRLARKLAPYATLALLADLALADRRGRNAASSEPLSGDDEMVSTFRTRATQAQVLEETEPPLLQGRDFLDVVRAGPELGTLVRRAYELQIDEGITDRDELKRRSLELFSFAKASEHTPASVKTSVDKYDDQDK